MLSVHPEQQVENLAVDQQQKKRKSSSVVEDENKLSSNNITTIGTSPSCSTTSISGITTTKQDPPPRKKRKGWKISDKIKQTKERTWMVGTKNNKLYADLWSCIMKFIDESQFYFLTSFRLICKQSLEAVSRYTQLKLNGVYGNRLFGMICKHMDHLKYLHLEKKQIGRKKIGITDINPLKKGILSKLEYLNLQNNSIVDVSAFGLANNMEHLTYLNLKGNLITTWQHLLNKKLSNLEYLNLNNNKISSLFTYSKDEFKLSNLKTLKIGNNNFENYSLYCFGRYSLSKLTNLDLKHNVGFNFFPDCSFCCAKNLEQLNISGTSIVSLKGILDNFRKLKILKFGNIKYNDSSIIDTCLSELSPPITIPLGACTSTVATTATTSRSPMLLYTPSPPLNNQIETLYLNSMKLTCKNIIHLASLKIYQQQLTTLNLSENQIGDSGMEILASVPNQLTSLNVKQCHLTNASANYLSHFAHLKHLNVSWNFMTNGGCLQLLKLKLDFLDITNNSHVDSNLVQNEASVIKKIIHGWGRVNRYERLN